MKSRRWSDHALANLLDRGTDRDEADRTIDAPEATKTGHGGRTVYLRRYSDRGLAQEMLLCVVVDEEEQENVVVTIYKTSKIEKYLARG